MPEEYRAEGRYITAQDVADRLMPDLSINEVLLWAPDLFAYTSYLLTMTSAYQLVVSPPSGKIWQPDKEEIAKWLCVDAKENITYWLKYALKDWGGAANINQIAGQIDSKLKQYFKNTLTNIKTARQKKEAYGATQQPMRFPWERLVADVGEEWQQNLNKLTKQNCRTIDDTELVGRKRKEITPKKLKELKIERGKKLLNIVLNFTPPVLLACWAFFFRQITNENFYKGCKLHLSDLLCNQDDLQKDSEYLNKLWPISQSLLTMHAISDIASVKFGLEADTDLHSKSGKLDLETVEDGDKPFPALNFAEKLLFGRYKGLYEDTMFFSGGSLSTFNSERCRVLPKRHNPSVGITLRSISSNLAFHQSAVDVVWRKTQNNPLGRRLTKPKRTTSDTEKEMSKQTISILLLPFPLSIRTSNFEEVKVSRDKIVMSNDSHGYFAYEPHEEERIISGEIEKVVELLSEANKEHFASDHGVDIIVFPEAALSLGHFDRLIERFKDSSDVKPPSIIISGVRESKEDIARELGKKLDDDDEVNFSRNAVYCKYYDEDNRSYYHPLNDIPDGNIPHDHPLKSKIVTPKYKQYKHHRWQLSDSQVRRYGLSSVLEQDVTWWESIKIPKRRVSFLNVGDRMTISHLICEDLARQDPIAELIRHVGPSLIVAILMDGPQLKNRWSARYATVMADDPGCSVITLTSIGMVKRHISEFGLMSRVIALWNESESTNSREIELAPGAEAVLLTLKLDDKREKTADGRRERIATSILRLVDVIQVYPEAYKS
jgi:predicted amidohydrolase